MNDDILETPESNNKAEEVVSETATEKVSKLPTETILVSQTEKIFSLFDEVKHSLTEIISGPSDYNDNVLFKLAGVQLDKTEQVTNWAQTINEGAELSSFGNQFIKPLQNPDNSFEQSVDVNGDKLGISVAKLKDVQNQEIEGDKALMMVRNTFGLGSHIRVPLFHSGFWITIKAPSDLEILELHRQITQDKVELGRASYGLAFSNQVVYYANRLLDFALNNIHSHSIKTNTDIRDFIYSHDVPIIIWGVACAIWPNGFKYQRACTSNPKECNHVATELINLSKLLWTNTSGLNQWQKTHMANKSATSMTEEEVNRYRKELLNNQPRIINIEKDDKIISFKLKVPTASQWINEGTTWVNQIVDSITGSFSESNSVNERNRFIINSAKASALRQYSHWVEEIEINTNVIKNRSSIESVIGALSADDHIRDSFIKQMRDYIDSSVISIIGVPSYNCPNCGGEQKDEASSLPKFVNIIPIDVMNTFFIPLVHRVIKIQNR